MFSVTFILHKCIDHTMNLSTPSVFIKKTESIKTEENILRISKTEILESIPKNFVKKENKTLQQNKTEWRWRLLNVHDREVIEMSYMKPNENRMYINKHGNWTESNVPKDFDKYVTDQWYAYMD
jgi:hypothetical protein